MSRASRDKGARGELEVAAIFREHGYDVNRVPNSGGLRLKGDLYGAIPAHVEVKRTERLDLWGALAQAAAECAGKMPLMCFRRNRSRWYVALPLDDLLALMHPDGIGSSPEVRAVEREILPTVAQMHREAAKTTPRR